MSTQTIFKTVGSVSNSVELSLVQNAASAAAGDPILGLLFSSAGLTANYRKGILAQTAVVLVTRTSPTQAWGSGGFIEVNNALAPGQYRFDIPAAALTAVGETNITFSGAPAGTVGNMETHTLKIIVTAFDLFNVAAAFQTPMVEAAAPALGVAPTPEQALIGLYQMAMNIGFAGLTCTVKKLDNLTTSMTFTVDDPNNSTQMHRAT